MIRVGNATAPLCKSNAICSKISGPLLDRIDIHIEVPAVPFKELSSSSQGTSSQSMREQVTQARRRQSQRFAGSQTRCNAHMNSRQLRGYCQLDDQCLSLLRDAMSELGLSARAHDKVLRVARTIADLESSERIELAHLHEAINYRLLDRKL